MRRFSVLNRSRGMKTRQERKRPKTSRRTKSRTRRRSPRWRMPSAISSSSSLGDLEQLVARVRLEDLDHRLVVVAAGQEAGAVEHGLHLPPQQRDLPRARAVDGVGEEAEEAALRLHLAGFVEPLDADVVEIGRPVHGRPRVRLGQVEQGLLARELAHLRRQLREAERVGLLPFVAEDAEPGSFDRGEHVLAAFGPDLVLPVAEEGEVVVVHPLQQLPAPRRAPQPGSGAATARARRSPRAPRRASPASPRPRPRRRREHARGRRGAARARPGR